MSTGASGCRGPRSDGQGIGAGVQRVSRGKVKWVESCKVGLGHWLDCHQRTQGTIVAAWDKSVSGLKLWAMSYEKGVMSLCSVTVLLWALRLCALSRQSCHGRHGARQWVSGGELDSRPHHRSTQLQISNPIQNQPSHFQSTTLKKERAMFCP